MGRSDGRGCMGYGVLRRGRMNGVPAMVLLCLIVLTAGFPSGLRSEDTFTIIGYTEEVVLLPWSIRLPARVDTGASMTSLDARNITVTEDRVRFKLPESFGEHEFDLPIVRWGHVRSSMGIQQRPVVQMDICVGAEKLRVKVNLNDRSGVKYPLIIGRNLLRKKFLVNPGKVRLLPPTCPEASSP